MIYGFHLEKSVHLLQKWVPLNLKGLSCILTANYKKLKHILFSVCPLLPFLRFQQQLGQTGDEEEYSKIKDTPIRRTIWLLESLKTHMHSASVWHKVALVWNVLSDILPLIYGGGNEFGFHVLFDLQLGTNRWEGKCLAHQHWHHCCLLLVACHGWILVLLLLLQITLIPAKLISCFPRKHRGVNRFCESCFNDRAVLA